MWISTYTFTCSSACSHHGPRPGALRRPAGAGRTAVFTNHCQRDRPRRAVRQRSRKELHTKRLQISLQVTSSSYPFSFTLHFVCLFVCLFIYLFCHSFWFIESIYKCILGWVFTLKIKLVVIILIIVFVSMIIRFMIK